MAEENAPLSPQELKPYVQEVRRSLPQFSDNVIRRGPDGRLYVRTGQAEEGTLLGTVGPDVEVRAESPMTGPVRKRGADGQVSSPLAEVARATRAAVTARLGSTLTTAARLLRGGGGPTTPAGPTGAR